MITIRREYHYYFHSEAKTKELGEKLDKIISMLETQGADAAVIKEQTKHLKTSSDELKESVDKNTPK